jgi:hypothetical protein
MECNQIKGFIWKSNQVLGQVSLKKIIMYNHPLDIPNPWTSQFQRTEKIEKPKRISWFLKL